MGLMQINEFTILWLDVKILGDGDQHTPHAAASWIQAELS